MLTVLIPESILALTGPALPRHYHLLGRKLLMTLWGFLYVLVRETPHLFMKFIDLTGQKFGRLTAIQRVKGAARSLWLCHCECGKKPLIRASGLRSGNNRSCGCIKAAEDLTGRIYSRLTVLRRVEGTKDPKWECLCECGMKKIIAAKHLTAGSTKSCGCLLKTFHTKHGQALAGNASPEYMVWGSLIRRTTSLKEGDPGYKNYKGRGIGVCDRWRDFRNFIADMGPRPSSKHSIDRVDNDKGYCPENCKWVTRIEQSRNRRSNRFLTHRGETRCLAEWSEIVGISYNAVKSRLKRGWSVEKALDTPLKIR